MTAVRIAGLLLAMLTAACARLAHAPAGGPPQNGATPVAAVAPEPLAAPAAPMAEPTRIAAKPDASVAPGPGVPDVATREPLQTGATQGAGLEPKAPPSAQSAPRSAGTPVAKAGSPAAVSPAKVPAPAAPKGQPSKQQSAAQKESSAPATVKQDAPPLDLKSLETQLKETKAIGVFTKLALKNQVDDLLGQFRAYYQGRLKTTIAELRRPYDMLILKVLALLQDADPPLAGAIVASREAIWGILADRARFSTI